MRLENRFPPAPIFPFGDGRPRLNFHGVLKNSGDGSSNCGREAAEIGFFEGMFNINVLFYLKGDAAASGRIMTMVRAIRISIAGKVEGNQKRRCESSPVGLNLAISC